MVADGHGGVALARADKTLARFLRGLGARSGDRGFCCHHTQKTTTTTMTTTGRGQTDSDDDETFSPEKKDEGGREGRK